MVEQTTLNPFGDTRADFSIPAPLRPFPGPTDLISIRDSILLNLQNGFCSRYWIWHCHNCLFGE